MKVCNGLVYNAIEKIIGTIGEDDKATGVKCKLVAFSIGQNEQSLVKYYDLITEAAEFKKKKNEDDKKKKTDENEKKKKTQVEEEGI
ncbi:unnamed protein product [Arabidopsis thaliana]|uniref:Uncharacterized protein n=1 Tax=Arabidopsis thaliana TaxID=3702 RepID=A0A5S9WG98_ARATH|nr:unnamed protein product [Arabidopsis thaliana]